MRLTSLIQVLHASHWSYLVEGEWDERGGVMIVAPPASFKTTAIKTLESFDKTLVLSDANVPGIMRLRDDIASGVYTTLAFTEYEKIYQRNPQTAMNVEGHLRAFTDEGFKLGSHEDSRMVEHKARCLVIGAMTYSCYTKNYSRWMETGFARRFLWSHYTLRDRSVIADSVHRWAKIHFRGLQVLTMKHQKLPYNLTEVESAQIRSLMRWQPGAETPFALLKKIGCVLKHLDPKNFMITLKDFAESLTKEGSKMEIDMVAEQVAAAAK